MTGKKKREHYSLNNTAGETNCGLLKDIKVPEKYYRRLDLGVPILNEIFGGQENPGIFPGGTYMFTGGPGAGKSTMCLQLADLFQSFAGRNTVYNIGEENKYSIKVRAERLGSIKGEFSITQFEEVDHLLKYCRENGVEVLFQDSLQTLRHKDLRGGELLKVVTKKLHAFCKENDVTLILVGHCTKNGKFAGPNEVKHDVDGHIHMKLNPETGNRVFELEKNRHGPALIPYEFVLSSTGLDFHQVTMTTQEGNDVGVSKAAERRDNIKGLIKEKLVGGEHISGYCYERFGVDCSGGFWRGMLARAVKELRTEGYDIGAIKDGPSGKNREHSFVRAKPGQKES